MIRRSALDIRGSILSLSGFDLPLENPGNAGKPFIPLNGSLAKISNRTDDERI